MSPRPSFSIPAMSPVQFYFSSSKITRVFQRWIGGCFFNNTVKPFYKRHLGDRGKWPLYGEVSVRVKHDTDIFMGLNSFVVKKVLSVTCKYVTQSKYINKREAKQKYRPTTRAGYGYSFATMSNNKWSFIDTVRPLLINWPLWRGHLGRWDAF